MVLHTTFVGGCTLLLFLFHFPTFPHLFLPSEISAPITKSIVNRATILQEGEGLGVHDNKDLKGVPQSLHIFQIGSDILINSCKYEGKKGEINKVTANKYKVLMMMVAIVVQRRVNTMVCLRQ